MNYGGGCRQKYMGVGEIRVCAKKKVDELVNNK